MDRIFVYQAEHRTLAVADGLVDSIVERFSLLADYPNLGRKCDRISPETFSYPAANYLIYYRKKKGSILIVRVIHGARDQMAALDPEGAR